VLEHAPQFVLGGEVAVEGLNNRYVLPALGTVGPDPDRKLVGDDGVGGRVDRFGFDRHGVLDLSVVEWWVLPLLRRRRKGRPAARGLVGLEIVSREILVVPQEILTVLAVGEGGVGLEGFVQQSGRRAGAALEVLVALLGGVAGAYSSNR
jgi:hypothetical protein